MLKTKFPTLTPQDPKCQIHVLSQLCWSIKRYHFLVDNLCCDDRSMTDILGQLKWESLKKRRKDTRLILLYKGLKGKARIHTDDLIQKNRAL